MNINKRTVRAIVFAICTLLSLLAILGSVKFFINFMGEAIKLTLTNAPFSEVLSIFSVSCLLLVAWIFYFYISLRWVEGLTTSLTYRILGTLCGLLSAMFTSIFTLLIRWVFAIPAILLMTYICFISPLFSLLVRKVTTNGNS